MDLMTDVHFERLLKVPWEEYIACEVEYFPWAPDVKAYEATETVLKPSELLITISQAIEALKDVHKLVCWWAMIVSTGKWLVYHLQAEKFKRQYRNV